MPIQPGPPGSLNRIAPATPRCVPQAGQVVIAPRYFTLNGSDYPVPSPSSVPHKELIYRLSERRCEFCEHSPGLRPDSAHVLIERQAGR